MYEIGDVVGLLDLLDEAQVECWLDGGWAVDALLNEQTRPHRDVDIVVRGEDLAVLRRVLGSRGYRESPRKDRRPWNFVLSDGKGHDVDVHAITLDAAGNGIYGPEDGGEAYPAASLTGTGTVNGRGVKCISPQWLVRFHTGYTLDENDFHDVFALCKRFGIEPPDEYRHHPPGFARE